MELFAQLVNDSLTTELDTFDAIDHVTSTACPGNQLKALMLNRSFAFPSGQVYIGADGSRQADLLLYTFHEKEQKMLVISVSELRIGASLLV